MCSRMAVNATVQGAGITTLSDDPIHALRPLRISFLKEQIKSRGKTVARQGSRRKWFMWDRAHSSKNGCS